MRCERGHELTLWKMCMTCVGIRNRDFNDRLADKVAHSKQRTEETTMSESQLKTIYPSANLYRRVVDAGRVDVSGDPCPRATAQLADVGVPCTSHRANVCESCDPCTCGRCPEVAS